MKKGLKGTYDVRVIINDKKYETGVKITCQSQKNMTSVSVDTRIRSDRTEM